MFASRDLPPVLRELLSAQEGVLTRVQAEESMGREAVRRLLRTSAWRRVTPGIYAAAAVPTLRQRLWAGRLLGGDRCAIGGRAALAARGVVENVHEIVVWHPKGVTRISRPGWTFRTDGLDRLDRAAGTLPVIRLEDALIDLGPELPLHDWVALVSDAVRAGKASLPRLSEALGRRGRLGRRAELAAVLADLSGIESPLEFRYLRDVERAHRLPAGVRQESLLESTRSDVHYRTWGVVVELDGRRHLATAFRDLDRDNRLALLGGLTLRYGSADVYGRPCQVAAQVGSVLRLRGWSGTPAPCRLCRRGAASPSRG